MQITIHTKDGGMQSFSAHSITSFRVEPSFYRRIVRSDGKVIKPIVDPSDRREDIAALEANTGPEAAEFTLETLYLGSLKLDGRGSAKDQISRLPSSEAFDFSGTTISWDGYFSFPKTAAHQVKKGGRRSWMPEEVQQWSRFELFSSSSSGIPKIDEDTKKWLEKSLEKSTIEQLQLVTVDIIGMKHTTVEMHSSVSQGSHVKYGGSDGRAYRMPDDHQTVTTKPVAVTSSSIQYYATKAMVAELQEKFARAEELRDKGQGPGFILGVSKGSNRNNRGILVS